MNVECIFVAVVHMSDCVRGGVTTAEGLFKAWESFRFYERIFSFIAEYFAL